MFLLAGWLTCSCSPFGSRALRNSTVWRGAQHHSRGFSSRHWIAFLPELSWTVLSSIWWDVAFDEYLVYDKFIRVWKGTTTVVSIFICHLTKKGIWLTFWRIFVHFPWKQKRNLEDFVLFSPLSKWSWWSWIGCDLRITRLLSQGIP